MNISQDLKNIFNSLYDGILIIDIKGIVVYINSSYTRITKLREEDIVGKRLLDVRKDSYLTEVMKTGKKKIGLYRTIADIKYLVNMVPIEENGKIIGGISVVNDMQDIQKTLDNTLIMLNSLKEKVKTLNRNKENFDSIVTVDKNSIDLKKYAKKISENDSNILISGEIGTGKEIFAKAIHGYSSRKDNSFICFNCASYDKENLEKDLFGNDDPNKRNLGALQLAENGTLFLDEISELDYSLQYKLEKFLQNKNIEKIETQLTNRSNIRIICSTSRNLFALVEEGKFRKDLYYRLAVIPLNLLPLRNRRKDILVLANNFLEELIFKYRKEKIFSEEVKQILYNYDWPGNIRELKNIVEFLFHTSESNIISLENIPANLYSHKKDEKIRSLNEYIRDNEKKYILRVLKNFENNLAGKKKAAEALGISLATLYNKIL